MRLIDADALKEFIGKIRAEFDFFTDEERPHYEIHSKALEVLNLYLEDAPTIEERETGRWTEKEVIDNKNGKVVEELQSAQCDQCGRYHTTPYMYYFKEDNFCPYCGAKMEV